MAANFITDLRAILMLRRLCCKCQVNPRYIYKVKISSCSEQILSLELVKFTLQEVKSIEKLQINNCDSNCSL